MCQSVCAGVASEPLYSETLWTAAVNIKVRLHHLSSHSADSQLFAVRCIHADRNSDVSRLIFTRSYLGRLATPKIGETENINAKSDQCAAGAPWQSQPSQWDGVLVSVVTPGYSSGDRSRAGCRRIICERLVLG